MMNWHIVNSDVFRNGTPIETHLYFLKDTGEIYRGSQPFTQSVIFYTTEPSTKAIGKIYINSDTGEGKVWNGSDWVPVFSSTIPIKGIDYFTEEDKNELLNELILLLPKYNGEVENI